MKYITTKTEDGLPAAVLFSEALSHAEVAKPFRTILGAGFCNAAGEVWGQSDSLGIKSRSEDAGIVRVSIALNMNPKPE